jgi:hypothetical protein
MAWRASVGTVFRSIRFTFNEASSSARGVAGFLEANFSHLKAHNPNLPVSSACFIAEVQCVYFLALLFIRTSDDSRFAHRLTRRMQVIVRRADDAKPVMEGATWDGRYVLCHIYLPSCFLFWLVGFTSIRNIVIRICLSALKADLSGLSPQDIESVLRGACESPHPPPPPSQSSPFKKPPL